MSVVGSFANYLWDNNNQTPTRTIDNDTNNLGEKTFWLEVTASNGCKGRDSIVITFKKASSVYQITKQELQIYPNPSSGKFNRAAIPKAGEVSIHSLTGTLFWKQNMQEGTWQVVQSNLPSGVYVLQWKGEEQVVSRRLVVE